MDNMTDDCKWFKDLEETILSGDVKQFEKFVASWYALNNILNKPKHISFSDCPTRRHFSLCSAISFSKQYKAWFEGGKNSEAIKIWRSKLEIFEDWKFAELYEEEHYAQTIKTVIKSSTKHIMKLPRVRKMFFLKFNREQIQNWGDTNREITNLPEIHLTTEQLDHLLLIWGWLINYALPDAVNYAEELNRRFKHLGKELDTPTIKFLKQLIVEAKQSPQTLERLFDWFE